MDATRRTDKQCKRFTKTPKERGAAVGVDFALTRRVKCDLATVLAASEDHYPSLKNLTIWYKKSEWLPLDLKEVTEDRGIKLRLREAAE